MVVIKKLKPIKHTKEQQSPRSNNYISRTIAESLDYSVIKLPPIG